VISSLNAKDLFFNDYFQKKRRADRFTLCLYLSANEVFKKRNIAEDETVFPHAEKARFSPELKTLAYFSYLLRSFCSNDM